MRFVIAIDVDDDLLARWYPSTPLAEVAPFQVSIQWGIKSFGDVRPNGYQTYYNHSGGFQIVNDNLAEEIASRVLRGLSPRRNFQI